MSLAPVPTLDELTDHPERVPDLSPAVAAALLVRVIGLQTLLATRALAGTANGHGPADEAGADELLDVKEAAARLRVTPDWLYRRAATLPFVVRLNRTVRCSARGLDRYIRHRTGRDNRR